MKKRLFDIATGRRTWQILFLVLLNLVFLGQWKTLCVPVLNCHSCPWAVFACPIGVIGHFAQWMVFPLYALGVIGVFGALFGRILCGWVCPFGLLQDLLYKIPSRKWSVPRWMDNIKYVLLVGSVILVPIFLSVESYAFFCRLCPAGTLESLIPRAVSEGKAQILLHSWPRMAVLALTVVGVIAAQRSFCRVACPIGAILALFNRVSGFSLCYNRGTCSECELCLRECPMGVTVKDLGGSGQAAAATAASECILCLNCTHHCPKGGLKWTFWKLLPRRQSASPCAGKGEGI